MEKKYKLTEETINVNGRTLYRIEALRDFNDVKKGDKGGFVEDEETYPKVMIVGYVVMRWSTTMQGSLAMRKFMIMR